MPRLCITIVEHPIHLAGVQDALKAVCVRRGEALSKDGHALPGAVRHAIRSVCCWAQLIAAALLDVLQPTTP